MFARPLAATTNSATATAIPSERDVDAHLSEGIPRFWLLDNTALETFVDNELRFGLQVAVEAKVLDRHQRHQRDPDAGLRDLGAGHPAQGPDQAGDGRLRRWLASCCTPPTGKASNWRCRAPTPSSTCRCRTTRPAGGCSVCRSWPPSREAAGVGHVLATDAVVVDTDSQGVGVQWSETSNTDDFAKNLVRPAVRAGSAPRCCPRWAW